jgi:PTS system nitrogen regulatory IIA component
MQLSINDVIKILNVPKKTIYKWIKERSIPFHQINDQYRFNRAELFEWATAKKIRLSPEIFTEGEEQVTDFPTLAESLKNGGIVYNIKGNDQSSVLKEIVNVLILPEDIDRDFLYQVLLARESLGSTGIGNGIAIPHIRNPIVLNLPKPTVTLAYLESPIDFKAIDGKPVNIFFTFISPSIRIHLHLLSRFGVVMQNQEFNNILRKPGTREEISEALINAESSITKSG